MSREYKAIKARSNMVLLEASGNCMRTFRHFQPGSTHLFPSSIFAIFGLSSSPVLDKGWLQHVSLCCGRSLESSGSSLTTPEATESFQLNSSCILLPSVNCQLFVQRPCFQSTVVAPLPHPSPEQDVDAHSPSAATAAELRAMDKKRDAEKAPST